MCYTLASMLSQQLHRQFSRFANVHASRWMLRMEKLETRISRGKSQASQNSRRKNHSRGEQTLLVSTLWRPLPSVRNPAAGSQRTGKLEAELSPAADSLAVEARRFIVRNRVTGIKFLGTLERISQHFRLKTQSYSH